MTKDWEKLNKVGKGAALKEEASQATHKAKHLKAVPSDYFSRHQTLKDGGKTSLDFSAYIIEAVREKLARDDQG